MAGEQLKDRIKALRKEKKMTLEQLAEASDTAKSYIWELENRDNPKVSAEKVAKIASVLGVTLDFLIGGSVEDRADAEDIAFFREYKELPESTKQTIRDMAKLIGKTK
ncbi:MAG: helix-turn-helix transcriptional regulator [Devosia indica]